MNYARGSIWRLWDLHYHTPSSYDVNDCITNEEMIDELLARHISVVAITDHHLIDVERIRALQAIAGDRLVVFPGIELRSELGGSQSVHYIGLFSPAIDLPDLWTTLQAKLSITPSDVTAKGGDDAIYVDFKEGSAVIHSLGGIVSVHAGKKNNTIERISHATAYQRAVKVDLIRDCIDIFEAKDEIDACDYETIVFPNTRTNRRSGRTPFKYTALAASLSRSPKYQYIPRGRNRLHEIFERHFAECCDQYEERYANAYGMFRLDRLLREDHEHLPDPKRTSSFVSAQESTAG